MTSEAGRAGFGWFVKPGRFPGAVCAAGAAAAVLLGWAGGFISAGGMLTVSVEAVRPVKAGLSARDDAGRVVRREFRALPGIPKLFWKGPVFKRNGTVNVTLQGEPGVDAEVRLLRVWRPGFFVADEAAFAPQRVRLTGGKDRVALSYRLERRHGKWTPLRESAPMALGGSLLFAVGGWGAAWVWLRRGRIARALREGFCACPAAGFASVAAVAMAAAMALSTRPHAHPDERWHYSAAGYFLDAWRLPAEDSPECGPSISAYGYSYLWTAEPVYFVMGKFMRLAAAFFPEGDPVLAARLFQTGLFALCLAGCLAARKPFLALGLLCSGQMWYLFSYVNGDALALALETGLLLCALRVWSVGARRLWPWLGAAAAVALILFSKKTVWFSLPPAAALMGLALWREWKVAPGEAEPGPGAGSFVRLLGAALLMFLTVAGLLRLHEALRHPSAPAARAESASGGREAASSGGSAEAAAGSGGSVRPGRPLTEGQKAKLASTIRLNAQGVSLGEMLGPRKWFEWSAASAFGVYGWMTVWQRPWFYITAWALFGGLMVFGLAAAWRSGRAALLVAVVCLGSFAALIAASAWWSWTVDFQPQGRYWLPGFPVIGVMLETARRHLPRRVVAALGGALFLLALYGFCFGGLVEVDEVVNTDLL